MAKQLRNSGAANGAKAGEGSESTSINSVPMDKCCEVGGMDPDHVHEADVWQLATLAEPVDSGPTHAKLLRYPSQAEQPLHARRHYSQHSIGW